ncbi:MAG: cation-translocating P-type ATPase [Lactobacillus iners]|nr:cation-translocating P-type ATPase [Lactobacillus iners]
MQQEIYQQKSEDVIKQLKTSINTGLSLQQVSDRLKTDGLNELVGKQKRGLFLRFIDQFKDFMIIVLIVAAILSGVVANEWTDAAIIMFVVLLNAVLGIIQEARSEAAIEALKQMSTPNAHVRRDGQVVEIPSTQLVKGDIVLLEAGDVVPADLRLVLAKNLKIEEAALTGESVPVEKKSKVIEADDVALGDRINMAYSNTNVTYGRGEGVVVATAMDTEVGKIATMLNNADETDTPLKANLNQLGKTLTLMILGICAFVCVVGIFTKQGTMPFDKLAIEMFLVAVSLAVAAIPEGLPAIVTIILALGTQNMAKHKAIVRKLPAVETLGATDIIASDKTGTLTQNKMTVEKVFYNDTYHCDKLEDKDNLAIKIMTLANDTKITDNNSLLGDPTETALIQYALDSKWNVVDYLANNKRVQEVPFDSDRKLMSTVHQQADGKYFVAVKGAPDELLKRAVSLWHDDKIVDLDASAKAKILAANNEMAKNALRVLGLAYKVVDDKFTEVNSTVVEQNLIFVGLVGMIDPERPEAKAAVAKAKSAGIRTIMITGDHQVTAAAIAKRLGIIGEDDTNCVITGAELDKISDTDFVKCVANYKVYARVSPEHKVRIVKAWQKNGKIVAMTGDGVNDAPSLKQADIGIGMGITGTEVSKGASDMVLADDNFATIVEAVRQGRKIFSNIQKAILYLMSCNVGEVLTVFMMTMKRKPRGKKSNFLSAVGISIVYQGILEGILVLGVYQIGLHIGPHIDNYKLLHGDALTMAFLTLGLIQLFHAFNSKFITKSIFCKDTLKNKWFNLAIIVSAIIMSAVEIPGLTSLFKVTELNIAQWLVVLTAGVLMIAIVEIVKLFQRNAEK